MAIYPDEKWELQKNDLLLRVVKTPGLERVAVYQQIAYIENRTDCFCCSCGDREGSDAACRNHGFAAQRPCEIHNMPGKPWGEEMCLSQCGRTSRGLEHVKGCLNGVMPESVQEYRRRHEGRAVVGNSGQQRGEGAEDGA